MTRPIWICQRCNWIAPDDCTCRSGRRVRPKLPPEPAPTPKTRGPITRSRR